MDKQMKTTKKINKLKQNGPKNVAAIVKSYESNFNNVILNNISTVCNKVEQVEIFELNKR
jgi:hypothetical protein